MKKRQKPRQESGKSGKSKKVAMVLTEVGSFAQQIKTYRLNSSMTFTMELPLLLQGSTSSFPKRYLIVLGGVLLWSQIKKTSFIGGLFYYQGQSCRVIISDYKTRIFLLNLNCPTPEIKISDSESKIYDRFCHYKFIKYNMFYFMVH